MKIVTAMTQHQFKTFKLLLGYYNMSNNNRDKYNMPRDTFSVQWYFLAKLIDKIQYGYISYTEEERTQLNDMRKEMLYYEVLYDEFEAIKHIPDSDWEGWEQLSYYTNIYQRFV